ncbi:MAG: hypothetical protein WC234_01905 [Endomicrobiaceae bacterium]
MKKVLSLLVVMACMVFFSSMAFASTDTVKTINASANFASSGEVYISFDLKNLADDSTATAITWDPTAVTLNSGTETWKTAQQYAVMVASVTKTSGAVYMYQDNKSNSADYVATNPRTNQDGTKAFSGLVRKGSGGGEREGTRGYVPLSYTMSASKLSSSYEYVVSSGTARYFSDKSDLKSDGSTSNLNTAYITIANINGFVAGVTGETGTYALSGVTDDTAYMYFGGGFRDIQGGDIYQTENILILTFQE